MAIVALNEQRKLLQAQCDEFWFNLGVNARKLFHNRGPEWVALGVQDQNALALIRKGWETEHERQLRFN